MKIVKRFLGVASIILLVVVMVVGFRTWQLPDAIVQPAGDRQALVTRIQSISWEQVADRLAQSIRFKTVSSAVDHPDDRSFVALHAWLEKTYPQAHRVMSREVISRHSLLFRWPGERDCLPAGFISHLDVVPVEQGTESDWTHPPFAGVVGDGFVWGRGAVDTKDSLVLLMEAAEGLAARGFRPSCDLYFIFGHDEEIGGQNGASRIAALLQSRGVRFAWLLDEGGGIGVNLDGSVSPPLASISVSSQGYLTMRITATAPGGHSALGIEDTAITRLSNALIRLQRNPMPARLDGVAKQDVLARAAGGPLALRVLAANLWLLGPLAESQIEQRGGRGMLRTTMSATVIEGGAQANILPQRASALVNARIHPRSDIDEVVGWVREQLNSEFIDVEIVQPADPPIRAVNATSPAFLEIVETLTEVLGPIRVVPAFGFGATDARHFQHLSDALLNFEMTNIDVSGGQHGTDERLSVELLAEGVVFYQRLMERHGFEAID